MTIRCESLQSIRKLNNGAFVIFADNSCIVNRTYSERILQGIPGIFFQLLMSKLKFAVVFIYSKNNDIDASTNFRVFRRVIETLQPAQVTDMDHTTDSRSEFNEHTIWSDVFHQTAMTASF